MSEVIKAYVCYYNDCCFGAVRFIAPNLLLLRHREPTDALLLTRIPVTVSLAPLYLYFLLYADFLWEFNCHALKVDKISVFICKRGKFKTMVGRCRADKVSIVSTRCGGAAGGDDRWAPKCRAFST